MRSADENTWVRQASQGDREAFARLVDLHWENVRRWLFGLTGKQHQAEDVAQETFLKAWTALPTLREIETFRVWLFRIARHCWLDARRRSKAQRKVPLPFEMHGKQAGPLTEMIGEEAREKLEVAMELLPSKFRAAYLLWTQQELPYSEIAQILGVSEETARWRVCKARQSLVQTMTAYLHCRDA